MKLSLSGIVNCFKIVGTLCERSIPSYKLKKQTHKKFTELIILLIFFFLSLRVLNWFEYPYIIVGGDLRPPLIKDAFIRRVLYTWDETDLGMPSVYTPRILDPFNFMITVFQIFGLNLCISQMITSFLIYFLSSVFMYMLLKIITGEDVIASFIGALYIIANPFLVNDREITAIMFVNTWLIILPCLTTFAKAIKSESRNLTVISGMLYVISYATYPNYRINQICLIMLFLVLLSTSIRNALHCKSHRLMLQKTSLSSVSRLLLIFGVALALVSLWIITIIFSNFEALAAAYGELSMPRFVKGREMHFVLRLIVCWGFDKGALGMPYIPYKDTYLSNPIMIFLSFLPAMLAFSSVLFLKNRKTSLFFGIVGVISLILASGFSFVRNGTHIYSNLTANPILMAFREPSSWVYIVVFSFSVLLGCFTSALYAKFKNKKLKIFIVYSIAVLLLVTTYPVTTGNVTVNWLKPTIKGSSLPDSYREVNNLISSEYWTILLPQRWTYVIYNFSGIPLSCGNPYPLIFSKPIISGCGTEYIKSPSLKFINELYDYMRTDIYHRNVAPDGKPSANSIEAEAFTPEKAIDGQFLTRWSSQKVLPQWFEIEWDKPKEITKINIFFESAYAENYFIEAWNGSAFAIITSIKNNTSIQCEHSFLQRIITTKIRLFFTKASNFGSVSIWELEVYARTEVVPKFLGMLGIKHLVPEKNIIFGNKTSVNEYRLHESKSFKVVKEWEEIVLFENPHALRKLYVANNILGYTTIHEAYKTTENLEWTTLNHSTFINTTSIPSIKNKTLVAPKTFCWIEKSPTRYEAEIESQGPFIIILLESFDKNWKLYLNGKEITEENHFIANIYANGWLIDEKGKLFVIIEYEPQKMITLSIAVTVILLTILLAFLNVKTIQKIAKSLYKKTKSFGFPNFYHSCPPHKFYYLATLQLKNPTPAAKYLVN